MVTAQAETESCGSHRVSPETALYVWKCGAASGRESQQSEQLAREAEIGRTNPETGTGWEEGGQARIGAHEGMQMRRS